jgi:hypothetical protein
VKRVTLVLLALVLGLVVVRGQILSPPTQFLNVADSGTPCSNAGTCATWTIPPNASVTFQLTGTMTSMTVTFEATSDNQTWFSVQPTKLSTGIASSTTTSTGQYALANTGFTRVRARCTTYASGGANISATVGPAFVSNKVIGAPQGGTGQSSYAVGDLLTADTTTTLSKLPDVAAGAVLISGGVNTVPSWSTTPTANSITLKAGGGTDTYKSGGVIRAAVFTDIGANTDTTNWRCYNFTALTAGTIANNGDTLLIRYAAHSAANATSKSIRINVGYSTCVNDANGFDGGGGSGIYVINLSTSTSSANIYGEARIFRTGSNTQGGTGFQVVSGATQSSGITTGALTESAVQKMGMAFKNATASDLTFDYLTISFLPAQ